jgi:hypothetical protein
MPTKIWPMRICPDFGVICLSLNPGKHFPASGDGSV